MRDNWFNRTFRAYSLSISKPNAELANMDKRVDELVKMVVTRNNQGHTIRLIGKMWVVRRISK